MASDSNCKYCKKVVSDDQMSIACDLCYEWQHIECVDISAVVSSAVGKNNFMWFCKACVTKAKNSIKMTRRQYQTKKDKTAKGKKAVNLVGVGKEGYTEKTNIFSEDEKTNMFSEDEKTNIFYEDEKTNIFSEDEKANIFSEDKKTNVFSEDEPSSSCESCLPLVSGNKSSDSGPLTHPLLSVKINGIDYYPKNTSPKTNENWEWKLVKNNKNKPKRKEDKIEVQTKNRFSILGLEEESTDPTKYKISLVGDSIIREQDKVFCKNNAKRRRICIPGGKVENLTEVIKDLGDHGGSTIASMGYNDLVTKSRKAGIYKPVKKSEQIYEKYKNLVTILSKKDKKSAIIGILPICNQNIDEEIIDRAISLNSRIENLCRKSGVFYIDMWNVFNKQNYLYQQNGLFINRKGIEKYSSILENKIKDLGF